MAENLRSIRITLARFVAATQNSRARVALTGLELLQIVRSPADWECNAGDEP